MTRKVLFVLVFTVSVAGGIFAQSFSSFSISTGVGGYFTNDFGGGVRASARGIDVGSLKTPYSGGGGFFFFDVYYLEMSFGFFVTRGEWSEYGYGIGTFKHDVSCFGSDLSFFYKFPIVLNNRLSLFPLFGVIKRTIYSVDIDGISQNGANDLSALWFKTGFGVDYLFVNRFYLRIEALYGLRMTNTFEDDLVSMYEYEGWRQRLNVSASPILGHGFDIKLSIGYRFW